MKKNRQKVCLMMNNVTKIIKYFKIVMLILKQIKIISMKNNFVIIQIKNTKKQFLNMKVIIIFVIFFKIFLKMILILQGIIQQINNKKHLKQLMNKVKRTNNKMKIKQKINKIKKKKNKRFLMKHNSSKMKKSKKKL